MPLRSVTVGCALVLAFASRAGAQRRSAPDSMPVATFAYDRSEALELRDWLVGTERGVQVRAIAFVSPRGGRATGLMFLPDIPGRRPGILLQHGAPGDAEQVRARGIALARHGAVVVALDAPFARRKGGLVRLTSADSAEQVQLVVDLQRAVDLLAGRHDVDPARIAYVGASYAGGIGALLAGVERRIKTYVLAVADGGLVAHFTGADDRPGPLGRLSAANRRRWIAAMSAIEPARWIHRAPPATLFLQSGRQDRLVPPADARKLHEVAPEPKTIKWYEAGHALNTQAWVDQLDWLARTIGTTPPNAEDRKGPPRTRRPAAGATRRAG